jgi:protein TonB
VKASLTSALTYTAAFAVAVVIHAGLAVSLGGFSHFAEDRVAESDELVEHETLSLTFRTPEPVQLQPKQAAPVTRMREPVATPPPVAEPSPQEEQEAEESGVEAPDFFQTVESDEAAAPSPEPPQYKETVVRSPVDQQPSRSRRQAFPTVRIDKPRPLQPIDAGAVYPLGARLRQEEGAVRLTVRIGEDGRVENLEINESSGFTALDRAAERAVRRTLFAPATRNDQPVADELTITIRFRLDS